jgi:tetratricopeptide (TPR) repeat protein
MGVVVPLAAKFSGAYSAGVWESIRFNFTSDWQVIRFLKSSDVRHSLALMSLTSLLPAFIMSFKWSANFGDSSQVGKVFVNYAMHLVNAVILGILVWVTFDPPFSPARLLLGLNLHLAALPFYYVIAVCIGYYSGYFLLLFGKEPARTRRTSRPEPILPRSWMWLCPLILACELAALATGAGLLIYKNKLPIVAMTDNLLGKYGEFCTQKLPPEGAILLCDSDNPNGDLLLHGFAVEAALARQGLAQKYPIVDTFALHYSPYHRYLHHRYPQVWPNPSGTNAVSLFPPFRVLALLDQLSRSNDLCYLNPSFGYYFERFYQEPHGLVYQMKALPTDTLLPPRLSTNLIAENDAFWRQVMAGSGPAIRRAINPRDLAAQKGLIGWLIGHLHILPDANPNALAVGGYYSKSLDALGVQVQRAGDLERAAAFFTDAQELNSNNVVASVNLAFNKTLRMGSANTVELTRVTADQFGKYHSWEEVVGANGPFDEPSFCFGVGCWLFQSHLLNQATAAFDRVRQMAPDNLATRLFLAQIYVMNRQPELALQALHDPQQHPFRFALTESNSTELNEVTAAAYFQKGQLADGVALLNQEMNRHPDNERLLLTAAQTFNILGLHTNALDVINRKLSHTPNDPTWLFGKGLACLQSGAYDESVATLTRLLEIQTNYPIAVFDRGLANLQGGHLDAARADFLRVQAAYTNNFQIAYGLGEVAWKQHQTNEAIRNYTIYLAHSPTNSPEQKVVRERLSELGGK